MCGQQLVIGDRVGAEMPPYREGTPAHGYGQPKDAWKQLGSPEGFPEEYKVPDGYTGPLYRAHRKEEMRAAHAEFTRRLRAAGWGPGDTRPPEGAEG